MTALYIALGIVGALILWVIFTFNRLVGLVNRGKEAWADIDVQLKRRYDLIPNLVETVKGYAAHEKSVFEEVTKARTAAMNADGAHDQAEAENMLSGALKSLFAVSEAYPDLKANENFLNLQNELTDTENKIQAARRFYNTVVRDLNTALEVFPTNLIAGMFNFSSREFFELEEEAAKDPVKVSI
ncbi:MAG: LemA family protein [Patescibacteria group bacterium UBA2103]